MTSDKINTTSLPKVASRFNNRKQSHFATTNNQQDKLQNLTNDLLFKNQISHLGISRDSLNIKEWQKKVALAQIARANRQ